MYEIKIIQTSYTVSQKHAPRYLLITSTNLKPTFVILSLLHLAVNLQLNSCYISCYTINVLLPNLEIYKFLNVSNTVFLRCSQNQQWNIGVLVFWNVTKCRKYPPFGTVTFGPLIKWVVDDPHHPMHRSDAASVHWRRSLLFGGLTAALSLQILLGVIYLTKLMWYVSHSRTLIVLHAWCAGGLCCWKITKSPERSHAYWQAIASESEPH